MPLKSCHGDYFGITKKLKYLLAISKILSLGDGKKKKKKKSADGICHKSDILIIAGVVFLEEFWGLRFLARKGRIEGVRGREWKNEVTLFEIPLVCTITTL